MRIAAGVAAAALFGVVATAAPASAHTTLTSSDPAKGSSVAAPTRIRLNYTESVRFPGVVVTDAKGGRHESGRPSAVDNHVVQRIDGVLTPGVYTVGWRVVAEDGHPVTGEFRFTVKNSGGSSSAAPSAPAPSAPASSAPAAEPARPAAGAGGWWVGLVIVVVGVIGGAAALLRRRSARG